MKALSIVFIYMIAMGPQHKGSIQSSRENFKIFLQHFFTDSTFQKSRVVFPFHERPSYLDAKTNRPVQHDTVTFTSQDQWIYIPNDANEKSSTYSIYTDTIKQSRKDASSPIRVVVFSKAETDLNLSLVFTIMQNRWFLIRSYYFEP